MDAPIVIIGAGIAGAATAAALARAGAPPGLILEREAVPGAHASGRNAGIARVAELDPVIRALAVASVRRIRAMTYEGQPVLRPGSGLYLGDAAERARLEGCTAALRELGAGAELVEAAALRARYPFLTGVAFDCALVSADEGVIDIHALLQAYLADARRGGFRVLLGAPVEEILVAGGRVCGVRTPRGLIRTASVVDASGAWAGRLGCARPLPLTPLRRHLFTSGARGPVPAEAPLLWHLSGRYYLRPEGPGLLLSACDESPQEPGTVEVDAAARELLAERLRAGAPGLLDLPVRACWACLRTFAPDRRPLIGPSAELPGLFHVSGLGGFGMGTSWAVGELAAALLRGKAPPAELAALPLAEVAPTRLLDWGR